MKPIRRNLDRSLALWLMTVILAIAGFCLSSPASAHTGHGHDGGAPVAWVHAPDSLDALTVRANAVTPGVHEIVSVLRAEPHLGCAGPCCTGPCGVACCCAIGLAPAEGDITSAPGLTGPVPVGAMSARTDVAPDSPSEPPRPFA